MPLALGQFGAFFIILTLSGVSSINESVPGSFCLVGTIYTGTPFINLQALFVVEDIIFIIIGLFQSIGANHTDSGVLACTHGVAMIQVVIIDNNFIRKKLYLI